MTVTIISPPLTQPVTLNQIKQHLRLDHTSDDDYLTELTGAATAHIEAHIGHCLINRTLRQYVDVLPSERTISVKAWPVSEILSITGYDTDGEPDVLPANAYTLKNLNGIAQVEIGNEASFENFINGLEIDFVSGHGDSSLDVPSNIIRAILVLIAHWYEFRGTLPAGDETALIPQGIDKLLAPVRRVRL